MQMKVIPEYFVFIVSLVYFVRAGQVSIVLREYRNFKFMTVTRGYYFGEVDILFGDTRKYTYIADEDTELLSLAKKNFQKVFFQEFRDVGNQMYANAVKRRQRTAKTQKEAVDFCKSNFDEISKRARAKLRGGPESPTKAPGQKPGEEEGKSGEAGGQPDGGENGTGSAIGNFLNKRNTKEVPPAEEEKAKVEPAPLDPEAVKKQKETQMLGLMKHILHEFHHNEVQKEGSSDENRQKDDELTSITEGLNKLKETQKHAAEDVKDTVTPAGFGLTI